MRDLDQGKCYQLYQELLEIAKDQVELCNEGDFSEETSLHHIKELLEKRQKLIDAIESLKGDYADSIGADDLKNIIQEILDLDQKSIQYFSEQRSAIQQKIVKIQQGKQSNKAYEPYAQQSDGYFIDHKK